MINKFVSWADFLHADRDATIFGYTGILFHVFDF